jgi:hypothetical protein
MAQSLSFSAQEYTVDFPPQDMPLLTELVGYWIPVTIKISLLRSCYGAG